MSGEDSMRASHRQSGEEESPDFDTALRAALHNIAVPSDLPVRIIARLEQEAIVTLPVCQTAATVSGHGRLTRRQALVAAGSIAIAAVAGLSVIYWRSSPRSVPRDELSHSVNGWLTSLSPKDWAPISRLPRSIAIDPAVIPVARQWQTFHSANTSGWSATVTALDLSPPNSPRAVLFVIHSRARFDVPSSPSANISLQLSGGFTGTAWQRSSGVKYVLVIESAPGRHLEDFLRSAAQA
jgi:hypothetical protein